MRHHSLKTVVAGLVVAGAVCSQAQPPTSPQGVITAKTFLDIGNGGAVADLTGNAKFPDSPDIVEYPAYMELYATGNIATAPPNDVYNECGSQIIGYFYPPATGDYIFYLASDDQANLYLSIDSTAANKKLIATETAWSNPREYTTSGGASSIPSKDSSLFTGTQWPVKDALTGGARITLTQGQPYYIEAIHKEGGGGDNLSVAVYDPGSAIDYTAPIPGQYLSSIDKQAGPLTIVTQPQSATVDEGQPVTFSIVVDGTPPYSYSWRKDGGVIATTTAASYTIPRVYRAENGAKYSVVVTGAQGPALTSADAVLTVVNDTAGPTLVSGRSSITFTQLTVTFSEPLDPASAETPGNYMLSGGVLVNSATLLGAAGTAFDNTVILTTSKQPESSTLTLTVNNVKDVPGNLIAANSKIDIATLTPVKGWATYERWHNENGDPGAIDAIVAAVAAGTMRPPDFNGAVQGFRAPRAARDNYAAKVSGFFRPPFSGDYVFFVTSDDQSRLFLSTDESPANKKEIARETVWSNEYQFTASGGTSDLTAKRSDSNASSQWTETSITLDMTKRYYIEILMDEGTGGDGAEATFVKAGDPDPSNNAAGMKLVGDVIETYLDPTGASITIAEQPQDATQQEERTATFSIVATGNSAYGTTVNYQWQQMLPGAATWTDIAGATKASYETGVLQLGDSGTKYRVVCSVPAFSDVSATATLTVIPDTFAPKVMGAGAIMKGTAVELGVGFDENVDEVTASTIGNYTLSKGTVTGIRYQKYVHTDGAPFFQLGSAGPFKGAAVVLTTSGLAGGDNVSVTVKNIKDMKNNTMSATGETKTLRVGTKMKWTTMGGDDYLQNELGGQNINTDPALWVDDVVAYSDSDFDLVSGGTANWNNYDEATFVYEEITGDFDRVVRVEYQDPTSQWARAGLCATPDSDAGMTRAQIAAGSQMERRFMQRANPAVQWNGAAGNWQYEVDWRLTKGGNYGGAGASNPAYPNAWMRMTRAGQLFTGFYSNDGLNWTQYGSVTFTDEPMPDKLMVGVYYTPENGNNGTGEGVGHSAVGKFRQYGPYQANPPEAEFAIGLNFGSDEYYSGDPAVASYAGNLSSIATAGAPGVIQANWNNLPLNTGTASGLVADSKGMATPTTAAVTWASANTWSSTGRGEENNNLPGNDKILMTGYLDTGAATTTTVTVTGLPTDLTAEGYDVYVYLLGGVGDKGGGYRIVDAANPTVVLKDYVRAYCSIKPTAHVQVTGDPTAYNLGTYIVFKGLTAPGITVEASTANGLGAGSNPRAPINAVQIVKGGGVVEPPGTMTISLSGGNVTVNWEGPGTLQSATSILGPWDDIGSTKPYTTAASAAAMYFRVEGQ